MAGETAIWQRQLADYAPSDGYALVYYFAGPDTFSVTADASTGIYVVTLRSSDTEDKPAGTYQWRACVERTVSGVFERREVDRGALALEPNFAEADGAALQAVAERMVDALEAAIAGRTAADLESFGQAGKTVAKIPYEKLHRFLGIWKAKLWRAQNPGQTSPSHQTRFVKSPATVGGWLTGNDGRPL